MFERRQEVYVHLVWSTWDRAPSLDAATRDWMWPVLAEQARALGCAWAVVGGVDDTVHVLCSLPTTLTVAALVQQLKGWTARAANARAPGSLRWQGGYGTFSVSPRDIPEVEHYVRNQPAHHSAGTVDPVFE
jgi:putative transposase